MITPDQHLKRRSPHLPRDRASLHSRESPQKRHSQHRRHSPHRRDSPQKRRRNRYQDKAKLIAEEEEEQKEESSNKPQYRWLLLLVLRGILCLTCSATIGVCGYMAYLVSRVVMEYRGVLDPVKVTEATLIDLFIPTFSLETYVCIGIFGFAVYLMMAGLQGLHGTLLNNKAALKLFCYALLFPILVGAIAIPIFVHSVSEESREKYISWAYETSLRRLYGSGQNVDFWSYAIDIVQEQKKCCGFNASKLAKNNNTETYLTILYWLESTNWGAKQAEAVHYNESARVQLVPESCCTNRKPGCNVGLLSDRLAWDEDKERYWAAQIYHVGCWDNLPGLGEIYFGFGNPLLAIVYVTMAILLVNVIIASILCHYMEDDE